MLFLKNNSRLLELGEADARLSEVPSLKPLIDAAGFAIHANAKAQRLLVVQGELGKDLTPRALVFDMETGQKQAEAPLGSGWLIIPHFAFSADGKKLGWAMGGVEVLDLATKKWTVLEKGDTPEHERYYPSAPYFTPDNKHVCVWQNGAVRILPSIPARPNKVTHCFLRQGGAVLFDVP